MGQVLHGCAATTHAVRAAIQRSTASIAELSRTYRLNLPLSKKTGSGFQTASNSAFFHDIGAEAHRRMSRLLDRLC